MWVEKDGTFVERKIPNVGRKENSLIYQMLNNIGKENNEIKMSIQLNKK
jgi:hypothetical protein